MKHCHQKRPAPETDTEPEIGNGPPEFLVPSIRLRACKSGSINCKDYFFFFFLHTLRSLTQSKERSSIGGSNTEFA